jgi:hypothetical protein
MRRRTRLLSKRQWLQQVKPLLEAPPKPPRPPGTSDIWMAHLSPAHRLLAHEYGVPAVGRALQKGLVDPVEVEDWLKQERRRDMERMMAKEPMK